MLGSFPQKILIVIIFLNGVLRCQNLIIKRSPLELGYVTFRNEVVKHKNLALLSKTTEVVDLDKNHAEVNKIHHDQEWIPGQIRHHSFIPAHVHHIYVPVLLTRDVQEVLVKPQEGLYFYPRHVYGGFGVGSYTGGQGAGHGFQIIFNS